MPRCNLSLRTNGRVLRLARGPSRQVTGPVVSWPRISRAPGPTNPGKPPSQATSRPRGGASVVVRARESRVHGEGRQQVDTAGKPQGKAMYVASSSDKDWLLNVQRKLYARSWGKDTVSKENRNQLTCQHLWRARCIAKGARRVRWRGPRRSNGESRHGAGVPIPIPCLHQSRYR